MRITVKYFGQLTDLSGCSTEQFENIHSGRELIIELDKRYPGFSKKKFALAVDSRMVSADEILTDGATIALMPPFSGG